MVPAPRIEVVDAVEALWRLLVALHALGTRTTGNRTDRVRLEQDERVAGQRSHPDLELMFALERTQINVSRRIRDAAATELCLQLELCLDGGGEDALILELTLTEG